MVKLELTGMSLFG